MALLMNTNFFRGRDLLTAALVLNILVLLPITLGLITDAKWIASEYGFKQPSRGILLAVYVAILFGSLILLAFPSEPAILTLLSMQIIYKVLTPFTVGSIKNKVVISNLGIAAFHLVAIITSGATL